MTKQKEINTTLLKWLVYVNGADEPIAAFVWHEDAEKWAEQNYPDNYLIIEAAKQ